MHRLSEFYMNAEQQRKVTVEDLANLILRIVHRNDPPEQRCHYQKTSLDSIRAFEFEGEGTPNQVVTDVFRDRYYQAVQLLVNRGYLRPLEGAAGHFKLTDRGREKDITEPVLDIASPESLIDDIQRRSGRAVDPVVAAYFREAILAWQHDLFLCSAFAVGAAAERLIIGTAELFEEHPDWGRGILSSRPNIKDVTNHLCDRGAGPIHPFKAKDRAIFKALEETLAVLMPVYRLTRNEVGHPESSVPVLSRSQVGVLLTGFVQSASRVLEAWNFLEAGIP